MLPGKVCRDLIAFPTKVVYRVDLFQVSLSDVLSWVPIRI